MKKLLLIDFGKEKDSVLKSKLEEMGYPVYSLLMSELSAFSINQVKKGDMILYAYDETEFNHSYDTISSLFNGTSFIFVVKSCSTGMLQDMYRLQNSWYIKEPFDKIELDFTIRMSGAISSLKASKSEMESLRNSLLDSVKNKNPDQCISINAAYDTHISDQKIPLSFSELVFRNHVLDVAYDHAPLLMLIVDSNVNVERINQIGTETIGKDADKVTGCIGGDVLSCVNSYKGDGCGTNEECSTCPVRNLIGDTFRVGTGYQKIESSLDIKADNGNISTHYFLASTAYVNSSDNEKVILYLDDITERKIAENTLTESEERFQVLYDNIPGGTLIIGEDYVIEDVNQRTCEITGYKREELVGQLCDIVCPKGSLSKKCPIWVDGLQGFQGMDTAIKCKDGTKTPILKNTKKIFIEGKQYILENYQDISERKQAEEAIINSKITAEEANRTKSEFLATMSHELRTPLNAVIGYSDILLDETFGDLNEQQKKSLNHISHGGKHLLKLINDILDISKVESGKMELHYEEFRIKDIFSNVLNIVSPLARKKDIEIFTRVLPENLSINADKVRFKQILFNLANNAVKFTPDGGNVTLEAHGKENQIEISVIDTGIGIAEEDIAKLFLPFQQIDSTMSRKYDGTGLGLSLVKRFTEMHGGEVFVESEFGRGSKFTIHVPLDVATH